MALNDWMGRTPVANHHRWVIIKTGLARSFARGVALGTLFLGISACSGANKTAGDGDQPAPTLAAAAASEEPEPEQDDVADADLAEEQLGPITKNSFREHKAGRAWVFDPAVDKQPHTLPIGIAEARGYTIIDLSNQWTPYIFSHKTPGADDHTTNQYHDKYVGLANDRIDHYGDTLREYEHNYLELYGIPPSLAVIQQEWERIDSQVIPCLESLGFEPEAFTRYKDTIAYRGDNSNKHNKAARWYQSQLFKKMQKVGLDPESSTDLATAATDPRTKKQYKRWRKDQDIVDVIVNAQRRFRCERLFNGDSGEGTYAEGIYDSPTTHALANFERKHDIKGWGHFKRDNMAMLALEPHQTVHQRLLRAIEERVVTSSGILEDGSAGQWKASFRWKDATGAKHPLPNLVDEYTRTVIDALGLQTPQAAKQRLAELSDLGDGGFENLMVAVRLPERPAYYSDNMQLSAVIDRGDIWYDFPYDDEGNQKSQPRKRYPHITLYVEYEDQKIPLVHWRTTIGSWRSEMNEGELMLKYKNSDVGPRSWKDIVAAPVWIPPPNTPASALIRARYHRGQYIKDINYSEIGPGYRSAYGLVAAYHIKQVHREDGTVRAELDNGIRTHGSVDYMSILRRFSHGCHRLYNMDAVRLFSFVLRHRDYTRLGQQEVGVRRNLEHEGEIYNMKIDTRGYKFELVEPIPVMVLEGRVRGRQRTPLEDYILKPVKPELIEEEDPLNPSPTPESSPPVDPLTPPTVIGPQLTVPTPESPPVSSLPPVE